MADNFLYVQNQPTSLAGAGASIGDTSIVLTSFLQIDGTTTLTMADFGSIGFGTLEPGNGVQEEQVSFTGVTQNSNGTATLTGVKTVLFISPYTQSTGLAKTHAGGSQFVISNTSGFYDRLTSKNDDETIAGTWTFTNPNYPRMDTTTPYPTDNEQLATKGYADSLAFAGAPNASTTVKGIVQEATQAQVDAKTQTGSTGAELFINPTRLRSTLLSDYVADTGTANNYAIAPTPVITSYTAGKIFTFKATNANTTASNLNVNSLGTVAIKKIGNSALIANDILASQIVQVEYDGTNFQMLQPVGRDFVDLTNSQTISSGVKTFTVLPQSSTVPSTGNDLTNKTYVDLRSKPLAVLTSQLAIGSGASETDVIANTSVAGGSLSSGRAIKFEFYFTIVGSGGSLTVKLYYGGSSVVSLNMTLPGNSNTYNGYFLGTIAYVGASSQYIGAVMLCTDNAASAAASSASQSGSATASVDSTSAQNVKLTVQGTSLTTNTIQAATIHLI